MAEEPKVTETAQAAPRPVRLHNYLAYGSNDVLGAGQLLGDDRDS